MQEITGATGAAVNAGSIITIQDAAQMNLIIALAPVFWRERKLAPVQKWRLCAPLGGFLFVCDVEDRAV